MEGTEHYLVRLGPYRSGDRRTDGVVVTFVNVTTLIRSEERQLLLIGELQHRTRNLLAVVQSIGYQTLGKGGTYEDFATRLAALGRVQSLIGDTTRESIELVDLVRLELRAVGAADGGASISGPSVPLGLDLVQTMGLALHELATNAVKYGALKESQGQLAISWKLLQDDRDGKRLILHWQESGVAIAQKPERKGFGRDLIEKALTYTLRAKTTLTFGADGVFCGIEIPLTSQAADQPNQLDQDSEREIS
jgi:two-component system CheB/CheR fusion protein